MGLYQFALPRRHQPIVCTTSNSDMAATKTMVEDLLGMQVQLEPLHGSLTAVSVVEVPDEVSLRPLVSWSNEVVEQRLREADTIPSRAQPGHAFGLETLRQTSRRLTRLWAIAADTGQSDVRRIVAAHVGALWSFYLEESITPPHSLLDPFDHGRVLDGEMEAECSAAAARAIAVLQQRCTQPQHGAGASAATGTSSSGDTYADAPDAHITEQSRRMAARQELAAAMAATPGEERAARPKARATDFQSLFLSSPLHPQGSADDEAKRVHVERREAIRAAIEAGRYTSSGRYQRRAGDASPTGTVDAVALVRQHLDAQSPSDRCSHCAAGNCHIYDVAAMTSHAPVIIYKNARRDKIRTRIADYALDESQRPAWITQMAELATRGKLEEPRADVRPVLNPTFLAAKSRVATEDEAKELLKGTPERIAAGVAERVRAVRADARARSRQAEAAAGMGPISRFAVFMLLALAAAASPAAQPKPRLVFDYGASGLNEAGCSWPMQMCSAAEIIAAVPRNGWVASVDLKSGFHQLVMAEEHRHFMAFNTPDGVRQPTRLMFGLKQGPAQFSLYSAAIIETVARLVRRSLGISSTVRLFCYIDDIFIVAESQADCAEALRVLRVYCESVSVELQEAKTRHPAQQQVPILGMQLDTTTMTLRIPEEKRYNTMFLVKLLLDCGDNDEEVPRELVQKVVGKLNHLMAVWPHAKARMSSLYEAAESAAQLKSVPGALHSLRWFFNALTDEATCSVVLTPLTATSQRPWVRTVSDAAGESGWCLVLGPVVVAGDWNALARGLFIGAKELYPLAWLVSEAGDLLEYAVLQPTTDNLPNVFALLKGHTSEVGARPWLAAVLSVTPRHGCGVWGAWRPRFVNRFTDGGSKTPARILDITKRYMMR